jgi:hypothetical protein
MYLHAVKNLPKFSDWLQEEVGKVANTMDKPSDDEIEES